VRHGGKIHGRIGVGNPLTRTLVSHVLLQRLTAGQIEVRVFEVNCIALLLPLSITLELLLALAWSEALLSAQLVVIGV